MNWPGLRRVDKFLLKNQLAVLAVLAFVFFALVSPFFASAFNLQNLAREGAELGIVCVGATLVLLLGRLDISVGAVLGMSALIVILGCKAFALPLPLLVVVVLLFGAGIGAINGVLSSVVGIPSFIATLISLVILRGVMQWASSTEIMRTANSAVSTDRVFLAIGNGVFAGIPTSVLVLAVLFAATILVLRFTRIGTSIYALGGNFQAALRAGLRVTALEIGVFAFAGFCSALAGIFLASRLDSVTYQTGQYLEFYVLIAVILGGTSIAGGVGGVWGTLLGVAFIGILNNGMVMLTVDRDYQDVVIAAFLVFALVGDQYLNRRGETARRWQLADLWTPRQAKRR